MTNDEKGPVDPADEQLMDQLKGLLDRTAPIPAWLVEAGKASYGLRSVDAELAELTRDSMVDEPALAVRGAGRAARADGAHGRRRSPRPRR